MTYSPRHLPNPGPDPLGEPIEPGDDENDLSGCCTASRPCADHFDDVFLS